MDCGPFGYGGAGHSHSDTLSIVLEARGQSILLDPGTYAYMSDPVERNWFRGSSAHNTVRVNGRDQGHLPGLSGGHQNLRHHDGLEIDGGRQRAADAQCSYHGLVHRRRVVLERDRVAVLDQIEGPGALSCEQIWRLSPGASRFSFASSGPQCERASWFSPGYGLKLQGRSLVVEQAGDSRVQIASSITAGTGGSVPSFEETAKKIESLLTGSTGRPSR